MHPPHNAETRAHGEECGEERGEQSGDGEREEKERGVVPPAPVELEEHVLDLDVVGGGGGDGDLPMWGGVTGRGGGVVREGRGGDLEGGVTLGTDKAGGGVGEGASGTGGVGGGGGVFCAWGVEVRGERVTTHGKGGRMCCGLV